MATHRGDETGDGWVALIDASDPAAAVGVSAWSAAGAAPEGVAVAGDVALVAMHDEGVVRFDLGGGALAAPTTFADDVGNAYAVAVGPTGEVAVGTVEGTVELLDASGAPLRSVAVSGPVRELLWLPDDALVAVCGSGGLDRIDPEAGVATAHADVVGSALDAALLADGSVAVADWNDLRVFSGEDLALLAVEDPAVDGTSVALLGVDAVGYQLFVAEWEGLRTFAWDPTVSAPDVRADVARIELGTVPSGEDVAFALVIRNEGPRPLAVSDISVSGGLVADRMGMEIPAGAGEFVEIGWSSDGAPLAAEVVLRSDDPDEPELVVPVAANQPTVGVGDPLPAFRYVAFNGTEAWDSQALGGPALLTYFATF